MDPQALEQAFVMYPDVKLVVLAHLYGTPAKVEEIKKICVQHGALLIEDAAESLGAQVSVLTGIRLLQAVLEGCCLWMMHIVQKKHENGLRNRGRQHLGTSMKNWGIITAYQMWSQVLCEGSGST